MDLKKYSLKASCGHHHALPWLLWWCLFLTKCTFWNYGQRIDLLEHNTHIPSTPLPRHVKYDCHHMHGGTSTTYSGSTLYVTICLLTVYLMSFRPFPVLLQCSHRGALFFFSLVDDGLLGWCQEVAKETVDLHLGLIRRILLITCEWCLLFDTFKCDWFIQSTVTFCIRKGRAHFCNQATVGFFCFFPPLKI